jgi:hypothetical protein
MLFGISNSKVQTEVSFCLTPYGGVSGRVSTFQLGLVAFENLNNDEYLSLGMEV